jgi:hypothetical protein
LQGDPVLQSASSIAKRYHVLIASLNGISLKNPREVVVLWLAVREENVLVRALFPTPSRSVYQV